MPLYEEIIPDKYDQELKVVVKLGKNDVSLAGYIACEKIKIETSVKNGVEKITNVKLLKPSPLRIKPKCEIFNKCGGCALQHMDYQYQLKLKTQVVQSLFNNVLKSKLKVNQTMGMDNPYHYRNKSQVVFKYQNGKNISGFYEEGTHDVIDFNSCYLQKEESNNIFKSIKELMKKMRLSPYDEDKKTGIIRHILIKTAHPSNDVLVVIVTGSSNFPGKNNFIRALVARHPQIKTIIQNINNRKTSAVLGSDEEIVYGKGYIIDELLGFKFKITSKSFYQINHEQTEKLYSQVISLCGISQSDTILDAYCGVGTIGILASKNAKKVIGVEIVKDAILNALYNAKLNNVNNISFFAQDATEFMINLTKRKSKIDIVIMDPPRSGSTKEFLNALVSLSPKKIIYVSCNPYTLIEDLKLLQNEYEVKFVQPIDMFPHTFHVETVVLLSHKSNNSKVNVNLNFDNDKGKKLMEKVVENVDSRKKLERASYPEIKEYILNKYNVKVSSLNIAQIKTKYGIIERECYNKPKSENSRQPNCTKEKEKLIVDALKHFKMI